MRKAILLAAFMAFVASTLLVIAAAKPVQGGPKPLNAVVTIAPLKGLIEPLLPPGSTVTILMQPGKSEHGYEFTPADIAAMAKADVFFYVGLNLEGRIEATLRKQEGHRQPVVCFAVAVGINAPLERDFDPHEGQDKHDAHEHHDHEPGFIDPHIWLDPVLVEKVVPALKDAIAKAEHEVEQAPGDADTEATRLSAAAASLIERVKAVDKEWTDKLAPVKGKSVVTHHNAFGRPAERYGFKIAAVIREFETSEPTPGDIANVIDAIRKEGVKTIFVEPQFSSLAADRIAANAHVKVGHLDPLGDGDWFKLMKSNLDALVSGLTDEAPAKTGDK